MVHYDWVLAINRQWVRVKHSLRWLAPGLGVKRWFLLTLAGTTLIGVGLGILILDIYRRSPDTWWLPLLSAISLRFFDREIRVIIFAAFGICLASAGILGMNRALMRPFIRPGKRVVDELTVHRRREKGPRIVAIGGGHGLATLLRGLKGFTYNLTAIVTVADDGGSSGRIRKELGILPPGDIRNCLAALSNDEALLSQLFQYRFGDGGGGLDGHSFGNIFISALSDITGSFEEAVAESGRVLAVHGRVLPSTLSHVNLVADVQVPNIDNEIRVAGESKIPKVSGKIRRVWLEPNSPPGYPEAIKAILAADLVIVGPGSLYTSIIPNLLVPDIIGAMKASKALKIYICNLATQVGETENYSCLDHVQVLMNHAGDGLFDTIIANNNFAESYPGNIQWVELEAGMEDDYPLYAADLSDPVHPWRHDTAKLTKTILDIFQERTGPLVD